MIQMRNLFYLILTILNFNLIINRKDLDIENKITLKAEITIGLEEGDENYIFGEINDVEIGSKGEIYILDSQNSRVQKFDKDGRFLLTIGRKGEGPGEFPYYPGAMTIDDKNRLYILLYKKILIFDGNGKYLSAFPLQLSSNDLVIGSQNELIILGFKNNKIFHVYNIKGEHMNSFGEIFDLPSKYEKYKNFPLLKVPIRLYYTKNNNLSIINPFKYEIIMYENKNLKQSIKRKIKQYKAPKVKKAKYARGTSFIMIFSNYSILEHRGKLFVSFKLEEEGYQMDIFKNYKYMDSIITKDFPQAIDEEGRIYSIDNSEVPKVKRYVIEIF